MIRKYKKLRDMTLKDVRIPNEVTLTWAVCAVDEGACGWGGWMLEAANEKPTKANAEYHKNMNSVKGGNGQWVLPAYTDQVCPRCGRTTFRTTASVVYRDGKPDPYALSIKTSAKGLTLILQERQITIPWKHLSKKLAGATAAQRANAELSPSQYGIHWPDLDEDLSISGILRDCCTNLKA